MIDFLKLKKEAVLLDSGPFVLKTFFAIATAYVVGMMNPIASKDMISVLFGLILTLEPINITGIRRGKEQFMASLIGAFVTAAIVAVFGVNPASVGASVAITLYVCLRVNWRDISPVALFTSIYMTQNMQIGADGLPSIWLTFQLRMIALLFGVLVAIVWNFIFSFVQYRRMTYKRLAFLVKNLLIHMADFREAIENNNMEVIDLCRGNLAQVFNDIDWIMSLFEDMLREGGKTRVIAGVSDDKLRTKINLTRYMRAICHLLYDAQYILCDRIDMQRKVMERRQELLAMLDVVMDNLGLLKRVLEREEHPNALIAKDMVVPTDLPDVISRVFEDVRGMNSNTQRIFDIVDRKEILQEK